MKYKSQVYSHCIAYIIFYVLMCHSAMCQLIRQEDMCYTVNCTTACANSCVNSSWANCSVKCCNTTGCLNDTFVSMIMETITGEQRHRSCLQSCLSHAVIFFLIIVSQYLQVFHVCVFVSLDISLLFPQMVVEGVTSTTPAITSAKPTMDNVSNYYHTIRKHGCCMLHSDLCTSFDFCNLIALTLFIDSSYSPLVKTLSANLITYAFSMDFTVK